MANSRVTKEAQKRLSNWLNSQRERLTGADPAEINDSMLASEFNEKFSAMRPNVSPNTVSRTRGVLGIHFRRGPRKGQDPRAASVQSHEDAALRSMVEANLRVSLHTHFMVTQLCEQLGITVDRDDAIACAAETMGTPNKGGA